jgi:uncharacterized membrane protein YhaH (DUF805 family)
MSAEGNSQTPEQEGRISKLLTFRGTAGQGEYLLGLIVEFGILICLVMVLAALNNPTGAGGGVVILAAIFPFLALYLHLCLVVARLRHVGVAHPVLLGIIVAILPFLWFGLSFEFVERLWFLVLIVFLALYVGPAFIKSKAAVAPQS